MTSLRRDGRANNALRPLRLEPGFQINAYASILITMGTTQVSCSVTLEKKVPPFLTGSGQGWITAEYGMLPCATNTRGKREATTGQSGRSQEIQRLIGRSLRMMVDLKKLGENTLRVDCDVLTADGGTRTASITGAALALRAALRRMAQEGLIAADLPMTPIAAISVGLLHGEALLDLDYEEDSGAEADANFVMTHDGRWVEMQCTAEGRPVSQEEFDAMGVLARQGILALLQHWQESP
jgi:ribonuclease PH